MLHPHSLEILDQNLMKFKITSYQNTLCWLILLSHHQFNKVPPASAMMGRLTLCSPFISAKPSVKLMTLKGPL